jgi:hypothetical protein
MKTIVKVSLGLICAVLWSIPSAFALTIPITCDGVNVGDVSVNLVPGGIRGSFSGRIPDFPTLSQAAQQCGEDHFNWYQVVIRDTNPPLDANGNQLAAPYLDPPLGGYSNQVADNLPGYWDEGPGFTDVSNPFTLVANLDTHDIPTATTLFFSDFPNDAIGTQLEFKTWLLSVNADGSFHSLEGADFVWEWTRLADGTRVSSNLHIVEPETVALMGLGLLALLVTRRRRI